MFGALPSLTKICAKRCRVLLSYAGSIAEFYDCDCQSRTSDRAATPCRRRKEVIVTPVILDMCFGDEGTALGNVPDIGAAGAAVGFHQKTARRARGLVSDALLATQEDSA